MVCDLALQNVIDRKPYPEDDSLVEVKFATSPIMSTYLVAFVIGEYDFVESQSSDGVTVRVYTPVGKAEQGKFALEVRSHFFLFLPLLYKDFNCIWNLVLPKSYLSPVSLVCCSTYGHCKVKHRPCALFLFD